MKIVIILRRSNGQDCNAAMQKLHNPLQSLDFLCGNKAAFFSISNQLINNYRFAYE